MFKYIFR